MTNQTPVSTGQPQQSGFLAALQSGGIQPDNNAAPSAAIPSPAVVPQDPATQPAQTPPPVVPASAPASAPAAPSQPAQGGQQNAQPRMPGVIPTEFMGDVQRMILERETLVKEQTRGEVESLRTKNAELSTTLASVQQEISAMRAEKKAADMNALPADEQTRQRLTELETELRTSKEMFATLETQRQQDLADYAAAQERERINRYRDAQLVEYAHLILPEFRDMVRGNTEAEVGAALVDAMHRSQAVTARYGAGAPNPGQVVPGAPGAPNPVHFASQRTLEDLSRLNGAPSQQPVVQPQPIPGMPPNVPPAMPVPASGIPDPAFAAGQSPDEALAAQVRRARGFDGARPGGEYERIRDQAIRGIGGDPDAGHRMLANRGGR